MLVVILCGKTFFNFVVLGIRRPSGDVTFPAAHVPTVSRQTRVGQWSGSYQGNSRSPGLHSCHDSAGIEREIPQSGQDEPFTGEICGELDK